MEKILIAMSHALTPAQVEDLKNNGYEPVISKKYVELKCNRIPATASPNDLLNIAVELVGEAVDKNCEAIAMTGEPMLTFLTWQEALGSGLTVLQSTTERKSIETRNSDGTVTKTNVFEHVQWRML